LLAVAGTDGEARQVKLRPPELVVTRRVDLSVDEVRVSVRASRRLRVPSLLNTSPRGFGRDMAADQPKVCQIGKRL